MLGSTRVELGVYAVVLALIGFWPSPVDRGTGAFLLWLGRVVPLFSYARLEFLSNVILFVPLGVLVARLLRVRRYLAIGVGLLVSAGIELIQWLLLPARTPSPVDVLANTIGTAFGVLIAWWWAQRQLSRATTLSR